MTSDERPVPLDFEYRETPLHETVEELLQAKKSPVYVVNFTQRECAELAQSLTSVKIGTTRGAGGDPERSSPGSASRPPYGKEFRAVRLVRRRRPPRGASSEVPAARRAARAEGAAPRHLRDRHARRRREHPDPDGPLHEAREVRRDEGRAALRARVQADHGARGAAGFDVAGQRRRAGARAHRREAAGGKEVRGLGKEGTDGQGPAEGRGVLDGRDVPEAGFEAAGDADVAVPADARNGFVAAAERRGGGAGAQLLVPARPDCALPRGRRRQATPREAGGRPRPLALPGRNHRPRSGAALPGRRGGRPPMGLLAPPGALALRALAPSGSSTPRRRPTPWTP